MPFLNIMCCFICVILILLLVGIKLSFMLIYLTVVPNKANALFSRPCLFSLCSCVASLSKPSGFCLKQWTRKVISFHLQGPVHFSISKIKPSYFSHSENCFPPWTLNCVSLWEKKWKSQWKRQREREIKVKGRILLAWALFCKLSLTTVISSTCWWKRRQEHGGEQTKRRRRNGTKEIPLW